MTPDEREKLETLVMDWTKRRNGLSMLRTVTMQSQARGMTTCIAELRAALREMEQKT